MWMFAGFWAYGATGESDLVTAARKAIRQNNAGMALSYLEQFTQTDPDLSWALREAGKLYYRQGDWNRFFGVAGYSRKVFPGGKFSDDLRALEILALLRHCQGTYARKVIQDRMQDTSVEPVPMLRRLADLLEVSTEPDAENPESKEPTSFGTHPAGPLAMGWWPTRDIRVDELNPFRFRRQIEPLCNGAGKAENAP